MIYATIIFSELYAGDFEKDKKYEIRDVQRQCENEWVYVIRDEKGSLRYVPDWRIVDFYDGETLKILSKDPQTIYKKFKADKDQRDTENRAKMEMTVDEARQKKAEAYQAIIDYKNTATNIEIQALKDRIKELEFKYDLEKDVNQRLINRILRLEELLYDPNR